MVIVRVHVKVVVAVHARDYVRVARLVEVDVDIVRVKVPVMVDV